jgi:hypothetical protein
MSSLIPESVNQSVSQSINHQSNAEQKQGAKIQSTGATGGSITWYDIAYQKAFWHEP